MSDGSDTPGPGPDPSAPAPAPGWYDDGSGTTRWWDGTQWGQAAPSPTAPPSATPPPVPPAPGGVGGGWNVPPAGAGANAGGFATPAAQPYGGGATTAQVDPGAAFSYGWKKFQEYWKEFLVMVVVVALISLVAILIAFVALIPAMSGDSTGTAIGIVLYSVAIIGAIAVSFVVQAGVFRAGLGVTKGVAPSLGMLVDTKHLGTYIGTVLLVSVAYFIGFLLCILPGFAVLFFTAFAPIIALDKGVGPVDAIKQSIDMVKNNMGPVFIVLILSYAVYYVGSLACYVGLLVSIPVALVMLTYTYRALNQETVVA